VVKCLEHIGRGGDLYDVAGVGSLEYTANLHFLVGDLWNLELHIACVDPSKILEILHLCLGKNTDVELCFYRL
jgi:hypothetical protein